MTQKTILYVDDEEDIRLVVSTALEDAGYRVRTAANVAEALDVAFSEFPDLVISDVMMPDESGYSFCTKLKADPSTRDIPVVFLTVLDDEIRGLEAGATAFLNKPFEEEQLLKVVHELLDSRDSRQRLEAALAHLRAQRIDEGEAALQQVLAEDPDGPLAAWASYYLGQVHQVRGNDDAAREQYLAALAHDAGFWRAHNRLAIVHEINDAPRAINHLKRSLALNPNQPDTAQRLERLEALR